MHRFLLSLCLLLVLISCKKEEIVRVPEIPEPRYAPGLVTVLMNKNISIGDVFGFINTYELETTTIWGGFYQSLMPSDSIPYIEDRIRGKSYMDIGFHISSTVWVNREPPEIIVVPRLMNMNDKANQEDWLHTMQHLQLESMLTNYWIVFRVPVGEEKQWASEFEKSEIVKGTRLFYPIDYVGENKKEIIGQIPY